MALDKRYLQVARELDLDVGGDRKARDLLESMLPSGDWNAIKNRIKGRVVAVFGCGPSLARDIEDYKEARLPGTTAVAVDGAIKALLERNIVPDLCVTDLDGDAESIIKASRYGCLTVVHAHADNTNKLRGIVPLLKGGVYGTTQVEETESIRNFGGFTDGDRAVYLVERFKPQLILLAGMDFGSVAGQYSGVYDKRKKPVKLRIGKEYVEVLARRAGRIMLNLTFGGEDIEGVRRTRWSELDSFKQEKS